MFLFIEITMSDLLLYGGELLGGLVLFGTAIKAFSDIRRLGWKPFKEKWVTPWKARRGRAREREADMLKKVEGLALSVSEFRSVCEGMGSNIDEILKEVKPNGGESLKDKVNNINNKVDNLVARDRHRDATDSDPRFHLDAAGMMIFTNPAFRELIQADESQLMHHGFVSLMEEMDQTRFVRIRRAAIELMMPIDGIFKFKIPGTPRFVPVRLHADEDVRKVNNSPVLRGFFGTASLAADTGTGVSS